MTFFPSEFALVRWPSVVLRERLSYLTDTLPIDCHSAVVVDGQAGRTPRPSAGVGSQRLAVAAAARSAGNLEAAKTFRQSEGVTEQL